MTPDPVGLSALDRLLPSLALIVGALLALRWWVQRSRPAARSAIRVLARTGLAKGAMLAVVAVGERRLLVGASEHGVTLLAELDADDLPAAAGTPSDAVTEVTTPALRGPAYAGRPWMGLVRRLQHMTVRQATPPRPPRSQFGGHPTP